MRFTQDVAANTHVIRGYGDGELRINDTVFRTAMIVSAVTLLPAPDVAGVADLSERHATHIAEQQPEVVLLGTGARQIFPSPEFGARFLSAGIGFEVMDTGAACRTFNVLAGEQRRVVALLMV